MISEKHSAAARANGALSRGPKTAQGKARSAMNALRHGLLAKCIVLEGEDASMFKLLFDSYVERLQPQDDVELSLVEEMVAAAWRLRRAMTIETHTMDVEMNSRRSGNNLDRMAAAFGDLASTPKGHLLERYQTRLHLMHSRALRDLAMMRQKLPQPAPIPNEPTEVIMPNEPTASSETDPLVCRRPCSEPAAPNEPTVSACSPAPNEPTAPNEPKPQPLLSRPPDPPPLRN